MLLNKKPNTGYYKLVTGSTSFGTSVNSKSPVLVFFVDQIYSKTVLFN
jgi:hypothetical protein